MSGADRRCCGIRRRQHPAIPPPVHQVQTVPPSDEISFRSVLAAGGAASCHATKESMPPAGVGAQLPLPVGFATGGERYWRMSGAWAATNKKGAAFFHAEPWGHYSPKQNTPKARATAHLSHGASFCRLDVVISGSTSLAKARKWI